MAKLFHEPAGAVYHGGALLYAAGGYVLGIVGIAHPDWRINVAATLLLGHAMTIAAYLIHEAAHNTVFRQLRLNAVLGEAMSWLCGASYGTYEDMRFKHFRHHVDNDDIVWFDYHAFFRRHPRIAGAVRFLEWFYIPAHDFLMHLIMMFGSFLIPHRRAQRRRNVLVLLIRGVLFIALLLWSVKAALLYIVAYMLMMNILRFMDSLQHDYGGNPVLFADVPAPHRGDSAYEQAHTFSNPLSLRYTWINWLTLNFGFHNAHHLRPTVPWYRLPAWHREQFGDNPRRVIPLGAQLRIFHKYRVHRVTHEGGDLHGQPSPMGEDYLQKCRRGSVYGGNAVSFLTSF